MAEKLKGKTLYIVIIAVAVILVLIIGGIVIKNVISKNSWRKATSADSIVVNEKDSTEVKTEKIQKKIELINQDIEKIQLKLNPELEKLNKLYEDYVGVMNEYQTGTPTEEAPAEENTEEQPAEETTEEQPAE